MDNITGTVRTRQINQFARQPLHLTLKRGVFLLMYNRKFAVIGTGIVGTVLAVKLEKAGLECIGVNTRSPSSLQQFNHYLRVEHLDLAQIGREADLVFITTQDWVIAQVAEKLSMQPAIKPGQFWVHCSGSFEAEVMRKNNFLPVNYLSIHPLQAFAGIDKALSLIKGTHFAIDGSNEESEKMGEELVLLLEGVPHKINPDRKTLYHAGAVAASNYLVALTYLAVDLLGEAGISQADAVESLLPLLQGSLENIREIGLPAALTGPIARGDVEVIGNHLLEMPGKYLNIYKALGKLSLDIGKAKKALNRESYDPGTLKALEELLS